MCNFHHISPNSLLILLKASLILDFTVPKGIPSSTATSECGFSSKKANFKTSDLEVTTYTSVEYDLNKTFESLRNQTSDLEGYNFAGDLEKYLEKVFFKENQKFKKKFKILERKHEKLEFYKPRGLRFHYNGFRKIIDNGKGINFIKQDKKLDNSSGYSFVCLDRRETDQQLTDWTRFLPEYSVESSIQGWTEFFLEKKKLAVSKFSENEKNPEKIKALKEISKAEARIQAAKN